MWEKLRAARKAGARSPTAERIAIEVERKRRHWPYGAAPIEKQIFDISNGGILQSAMLSIIKSR
jgi:hypothetical protein